MNREIIQIPLSKTKLLFGIIGSLIFILLGNLLIVNADVVNSTFSNGFIIGMGLVCVIFFTTTGIFGLIKFLSKKPGLQIDEQGITDHSNATSVGLIEWKDILALRQEQVMTTKFILVDVENPDHYIQRLSGFKQKLLIANYKKYNTPITITCNTLKIKCNELLPLLQEQLGKQ